MFKSLVENSRLEEVQKKILRGSGAKHFADTWSKSTTQLRMGLMLVADEILETDADILNSIVSELISLLGSEDASLRGDTADLLGRIGDPSAIEALEALKSDSNPDVAEIAAEALEEIRDRE